MKKKKLTLCMRCWDMTKPLKNNKKCSKCKKNYKYSKREYAALAKKANKAINSIDWKKPMKCDARRKADYFESGGSDYDY